MASNINVSIDAITIGGSDHVDSNFTFTKSTMHLSDIGTYSVRESGEEYFEIVVSSDCPNDHYINFNIRATYENGLDEKDENVYTMGCKASFTVTNGILLPVVIDEDMTLEANRRYIVSHDITITENATVTIEPGVNIVYNTDKYASNSNPFNIKNYGTILCNGTENKIVNIDFGGKGSIYQYNNGFAEFTYTQFIGSGSVYGDTFDHCIFTEVRAVGSSFSNSKFHNGQPSGGVVKHCQIIDGKNRVTIPWQYSDTVFKDSVFLLNEPAHQIQYASRAPLDFDNVESIVQRNDKSYIVIHCIASTRLGEMNISRIEYEANAFATCFDGTIATLSDAECAELGLSGYLYPSKGAKLNWDTYATAGSIIFETDTANITEEDVWAAYEMYLNTAIGRQGLENSAILGLDIVLNNYYISNSENGYRTNLSNVYWGTDSQSELEKMIVDYNVYGKYSTVLPEGYLTAPTESMWPMVSNVYILDEDGEKVNVIGGNTVQFVVEFNRDMNMAVPLDVTFGSWAPYADYNIEGEWKTPRQWVGEYTLRASIENGIQHLLISGAQAAEDAFFTAEDKTGRFTFIIDTTEAMAMNLQAIPEEHGIELTFVQDDYDTLLGYNIYRSTEEDGNFVRINPTIIPEGESTFVDTNAEPGRTYWYTYTVVLTDFTESTPAGKVVCTALDTILPNIYHTPVNQGYLNNNLVISATATDNIAVRSVTLYYRTVGATDWNTLTMSKQNDKYSATIFGSELTLDGIEYYIVATDGFGSIEKGSATAPYTVVIKDSSAIARLGDVDGDGVVNTKDALMMMQAINDDLILTDDQFKRADLNKDGVISSVEALRILQYINGKVNTLEMQLQVITMENKTRKLLIVISIVSLICSLVFGMGTTAYAETPNKVTATTSTSLTQGNSGQCYVYIDSLENVSTLNLSIYYDSSKVTITSTYNSVSCSLYDSAINTDSLNYSYIFDGNGAASKTRLFYFYFTVNSTAEVGNTYFDIVVSDAYDSALNEIEIDGSRTAFTIEEKVVSKTATITGTNSVSTSIEQEFELSYRFSTTEIASGSATITYDSELLEIVSVEQGEFLSDKFVDVNTELNGSIYISFVSTEYSSSKNFVTVKFKTLQNVATSASIKMTVADLYDLDLNYISCSTKTTTINVSYDEMPPSYPVKRNTS